MREIIKITLMVILIGGISLPVVAETYGGGSTDYREPSEIGGMRSDVPSTPPSTLGSTTLGQIPWAVSLDYAIPSGKTEEIGRVWVSAPFNYDFMRPLGRTEGEVPPYYTMDPSN